MADVMDVTIYGLALGEARRLTEKYDDYDRSMLLARIGQLEYATLSLGDRAKATEQKYEAQKSVTGRLGIDRDIAQARVRVLEGEAEQAVATREKLVKELVESDDIIEGLTATIATTCQSNEALKGKLDRAVRAIGHSVLTMGELMERVGSAA